MGQLQGLRILIVEDDFVVAEDLAHALTEAGAVVEGPVGSLAEALDLASRLPHLDHAILDVVLRRETVHQVADMLSRRAVPFSFLTGTEPAALAAEFGDAPIFSKPAATGAIIAHLAQAQGQTSWSRAKRSAPSSALPAGGIVGNSAAIRGA